MCLIASQRFDTFLDIASRSREANISPLIKTYNGIRNWLNVFYLSLVTNISS